MSRTLPSSLFALLLALPFAAAPSLAAPFTGVLEMKVSTGQGPVGTGLVSVGDAGVLSQMTMAPPPGMAGQPTPPAITIKTLVRKDKPAIAYVIDDANKIYHEIDKASVQGREPAGDETWTVQKLGKEKVAGFECQHVKLTSSKGLTLEMWTTRELIDVATFQRSMGQSSRINESMMSALAKQDADGFPAKISGGGPQGSMTMELVKAERKALPASLFELPAGYTKAAGPLMPGAMSPEMQKKIEERLKAMTPEQRAALEKAMAK